MSVKKNSTFIVVLHYYVRKGYCDKHCSIAIRVLVPVTIMKSIQGMRCIFFVLCSCEQCYGLHYFDEERNRFMDSTTNI